MEFENLDDYKSYYSGLAM